MEFIMDEIKKTKIVSVACVIVVISLLLTFIIIVGVGVYRFVHRNDLERLSYEGYEILESCISPDGRYTVARIDQESGDYMLLPLVVNTTEGPQTHGTYIWAEFDNLQAVEDRIIEGPYIHHFIEIAGDYKKELYEFCKYFPNLKIDKTLE